MRRREQKETKKMFFRQAPDVRSSRMVYQRIGVNRPRDNALHTDTVWFRDLHSKISRSPVKLIRSDNTLVDEGGEDGGLGFGVELAAVSKFQLCMRVCCSLQHNISALVCPARNPSRRRCHQCPWRLVRDTKRPVVQRPGGSRGKPDAALAAPWSWKHTA